jgi:hypothetical protein
MHYQRIALILIVLLAIAVNAATNIVPAPHLPRRQTNTMHSDDVFFCRGGTERCLEEVQIAPRCTLLRAAKIAVRHGVMLSGHSTISLPRPALKPYKQRVHTMNEVIVSL